jgi:hypothetical protein
MVSDCRREVENAVAFPAYMQLHRSVMPGHAKDADQSKACLNPELL